MRHRYFKRGVYALLAVAAIVVACIYTARHRLANLELTCEQISRWAREQPLPAGAHRRCQLPASLSVPRGSEVNLVKTAHGEIVVLLKTEIGWKGNDEGVLYSTRPLGDGDIRVDYYGREEVNVPGIEASPPVIRKRVNSRFFCVYFDLG
jgi:hypothetical protein